jgi:hypothetical protein
MACKPRRCIAVMTGPARGHVILCAALDRAGWAVWHFTNGRWRTAPDGDGSPSERVLIDQALQLAPSWDVTITRRPIDPRSTPLEEIDRYPLRGDLRMACNAGEPSRPEKWAEVHWDADASCGAVVETFMDLDRYLKANTPTGLAYLPYEFRVRHDLAAAQALPAT